jgi:cell division septation protein DedD
MPLEPEKPIEKLLRGWSKERRDRAGESWEIHPATRRLWQREVERQFGRASGVRAPWFARLTRLGWLRPAGALAGIALLAVFSWALLSRPAPRAKEEMAAVNRAPTPLAQGSPAEANSADQSSIKLKKDDGTGKSKELLAQNSPTPKPRQLEEQLQKSVSGAKDGGARGESSQDHAAAASGTPVQLAQTEPSSALASAGASANEKSGFVSRYGVSGRAETRDTRALREADTPPSGSAANLAANQPAAASLLSEAQAPVPGSASTNVVQYGFFVASQTAGAPPEERLSRRAFSDLATSASKQPAQNGILVSFRVEQAGQQLRIIDSDGSVYAGPIQDREAPTTGIAAPAIVSNTLESEAVNVDALILQTPTRGVGSFFQVAGTNLRSQQRVVFSGALLGGTNMAATGGQLGAQGGRGFGGAMRLAQTNAGVPNLRLSGTAVIGGNQQLHIEATPVNR